MKPLTVIIRRPGRKGIGEESLLAGRRYDMECETTGSRPPAVITWYKGRRRQLKHTTVREKNKKQRARARSSTQKHQAPYLPCGLPWDPVAFIPGHKGRYPRNFPSTVCRSLIFARTRETLGPRRVGRSVSRAIILRARELHFSRCFCPYLPLLPRSRLQRVIPINHAACIR